MEKKAARAVFSLLFATFLAALLAIALKPARTAAAVNRQINFQGKIILNSNSTNIPNGTYNMEFKIYSGGDGVVGGGDETLLWTEDHLVASGTGVTITDGIFQVNLGSVTSLPGSVDFNNSTLWLSMNLGSTSVACTPFSSCSGDGEMSPFVRFTAAPYAFNSDTLDGLDSTAFGQLASNQTWSGTNTLQPTTNITTAIIKQTSAASPTADIFNIQTANNSSILQVTGTAANQAAVTLSSVGATRDLTLDSASGTLKLGPSTTTLQKSGTAFTFDINNASNSTLTVTNAGSGVASLSVEGGVTIGSGQTYQVNGIQISSANLSNDSNLAKLDATQTFTGPITLQNASNSTSAFSIKTAGGSPDTLLTADTTNNRVKVGNDTAGSGADTTLFVVDNATTANQPTGVNGGIYYDTSLNKFQCYQNNAWSDCLTNVVYASSTSTQSIVSGRANVTASQTGLSVETLVFTSATAVSNTAGATGFTAPANGSFRSCLVKNNANITGGTLALRWQVNGVSVGAPTCNMDSTAALRRSSSAVLDSGAVTFSAGDTIGVAFDTDAAFLPATDDFTVFWTVEYNSTSGDALNLQYVYDSSASPALVTTSDAKDLQFGLADTATDANFLVNAATGSTGKFAVQGNGTDVFSVAPSSGNITLGNTSGGTITIGATSGTNLILQDNDWGITGSGAATFTGVNSGTGLIQGTGGLTVAGTTAINSTGTANTTIGNSAGGTITVGATSGSDLVLQDAQWGVTSTGAATFASVNSGSGTITTSGTIGTAGVTTFTGAGATFAGALSLNTTGTGNTTIGNTAGGTITIGGASGSNLILQDAQWNITGAGAATFVGVNSGSGQIQGTGGTSVSGNASLGTAAGNTVSLGNSTGVVTVTGNSSTTFVINGVTVDATEFGRLDGKDAALVDQNDFISGDGAGATSSGSGLESGTGGIGLLQGCSDGQVLKWNDSASTWGCAADNSPTSKFIVKGANENVPSGTTLQDDDDLKFPVASGETWVFDFVIRATNNNSANPDWNSAIKGATGWTCNWTLSGTEPAGAAFPQANGTDCDASPTALNDNNISASSTPFQVNMRGVITTTSAGTVTLQWAPRASGSLTVMAGSYVIAQKVGGSDLAEIYYTNDDSIEPGDVVGADPSLNAGVKKSGGPYDNRLVGVISTQPGLLLGDATTGFQGRAVELALSGRVPVKVSTENGPISPGDALTSSSTPGVAMKATKAGMTIGQALTGYDGTGVGTVDMFIKNGQTNGDAGANAAASGQDILAALMSGTATTTNTASLSNVNTDKVIAGTEAVTPKLTANEVRTNIIGPATGQDVTIDLDAGGKLLLQGPDGAQAMTFDDSGNLSLAGSLALGGGLTVQGPAQFNGETIFDKLVTFSDDVVFKGNVVFNNNSGGYALIKSGQQSIDVKFQKPYSDTDTLPVITLSIRNGQFANYAYQNLDKNGFTIVLDQPAANDTEFAWTALTVTDPKTSQLPTQ